MLLFFLADKAANGPANKKSKKDNKKGENTANTNENVSFLYSSVL